MNIDPNKPADKPTEELTEKELDGVAGGAYGTDGSSSSLKMKPAYWCP